MNTQVATRADAGELMESVIIKGDLSKLTPQERSQYYIEVCRSVGLNPLTKPFDYIVLNGKLTLYALRNCTDQLRTVHKVSVEDLSETERDGVFIVTAKVRNAEGRTDMAKGAVNIASLKGEALANAMMKAETKAKRRATLSLCGLGFLDETEIEDIPAARAAPVPAPFPVKQVEAARNTHDIPDIPEALRRPKQAVSHDPETGEVGPHYIKPVVADDGRIDWLQWGRAYAAAVKTSTSLDEADAWAEANDGPLGEMKAQAAKTYAQMIQAIAKHRASLLPEQTLLDAG